MPTKRNRKDSESSNCSFNGMLESPSASMEIQPSTEKTDVDNGNGNEYAWLRPCCSPMGCITEGGHVNLTKPDEIGKVVCSNENCTAGPYMHKECFTRWEDGLLTYLRSHGRARSWSEKQRRQNLWTKRGYDLAYRACTCLCGRGHLRKDLNWNPKDITPPNDTTMKEASDDATKKKNRKKHKDLPTLGNKYTFAVARSKSKAIPTTSGKDSRVRTSSSSSGMSIDQGYSSSSPSNSDSHGPLAGGFFSPPQQHNGRGHIPNNHRIINRSGSMHGSGNPLFSHVSLPQIPDNDILEDFCDIMPDSTSFGSQGQSLFTPDPHDVPLGFRNNQPKLPLHSPGFEATSSPPPIAPQVSRVGNIFASMNLSSQRQRCHSWSDPYEPFSSEMSHFKHESMSWSGKCGKNVNKFFHGASLDIVPENTAGLPFPIGHWGDVPTHNSSSGKPGFSWDPRQNENPNPMQGCPSSGSSFEQSSLMGLQDTQSMLCSDIDLKKPKVIIIPGNGVDKRTCTEITVTPMCNTTFHKRHDFSGFQRVLKASQVNPYHIKMEGEGYGSDDFRNSILAKLSKEKCCKVECVTCGKNLPIYDHFPLLDGTLFFSPLQGRIGTTELKIDIENKCEYLHAVCVGCLDGANNLICMMCEKMWRGPFHQLGSMYMFDVFAAAPCCQNRLCCKQCGYAIADVNHGMKFYSQYSEKISCPSCGSLDYHFVHPASTYKVLGPKQIPFYQ